MERGNSSNPSESRSGGYQHTSPAIPSNMTELSMTDLAISTHSPSTPTKRSTGFRAPVTPSTIQKHQSSGGQSQIQSQKSGSVNTTPLLHPPTSLNPSIAASMINSPFNGLKSPEFVDERAPSPVLNVGKEYTQAGTVTSTPKSTSISTSTSDVAVTPSLKSVSRKLFPLAGEKEDIEFSKDSSTGSKAYGEFTLVPLGSPLYTKSDLEPEIDYTDRSHPLYSKKKHQKLVPGTPDDKIITFELSEKWVNKEVPIRLRKDTDTVDSEVRDSDDEDSVFVSKSKELKNPFLVSDVPSERTRRLRQEKLLRENPDIEKFVTYVDKYGDTVVRKPRSHLRPKMLFKEQLYQHSGASKSGSTSRSRSRSSSPEPSTRNETDAE